MRRLIFAVVLILLITSCSKLQKQIQGVGFRIYSNRFTQELSGATESRYLYRGFETVALAKATRFSVRLMEDYVKYTQRIISVNFAPKKGKELINEAKKYELYWLAFYTPDMLINNLSSDRSFWTVYLSCGGHVYFPYGIKTVRSASFASQWLYMIHAARWSEQYSIRFKKGVCKNRVAHLIITSYLGTIEFSFKQSEEGLNGRDNQKRAVE